MTPQEINLLAEAIIRKGVVGPTFLIVWVALTALGAFFGSYLREKGKNTATKEDIKGVTQSIKEIEHQFDQRIEDLRGKHALRMAAADKRLAVHQGAHSRIHKLVMNLHQDSIRDIFSECQNWWTENSLYLAPDAREAFLVACNSALNHRDFLKGGFTDDQITKNWNRITGAADVIAQGVELPPLGKRDFMESLKRDSQQSHREETAHG